MVKADLQDTSELFVKLFKYIQIQKSCQAKNLLQESLETLRCSNSDKLPDEFQSTCVFETGLSDFHKTTIAVMKLHFPKQKPKINCKDYKKFRNDVFRAELDNELLICIT